MLGLCSLMILLNDNDKVYYKTALQALNVSKWLKKLWIIVYFYMDSKTFLCGRMSCIFFHTMIYKIILQLFFKYEICSSNTVHVFAYNFIREHEIQNFSVLTQPLHDGISYVQFCCIPPLMNANWALEKKSLELCLVCFRAWMWSCSLM